MIGELTTASIEPHSQVPLRIVIVEDDPVMQLGLEQFLEDYGGFQVIGQAEDGYSGIALTLDLKPDLVVMDIGLPKLDGIEATQHIKQKIPEAHIVMLTSHTSDVEMIPALASGADAYCIKGTSLEQLAVAIESYFLSQEKGFLLSQMQTAEAILQNYCIKCLGYLIYYNPVVISSLKKLEQSENVTIRQSVNEMLERTSEFKPRYRK